MQHTLWGDEVTQAPESAGTNPEAGPKNDGRSADRTEGPLAEFNALRQEIVTRIPLQQNVFVLQLTTTGAIFGLVLSNWNLVQILYVLPVTSYLFASSHYDLHHVIRQLAGYINEELDRKVPGGLGWEDWVQRENSRASAHRIRTIHPYLLAFPGPAGLAEGILLFRLAHSPSDEPYRWAFWSAWGLGAILTLLSLQIAVKLAKPPQTRPEEDEREEQPSKSEEPVQPSRREAKP
jgi:hypothetical protein